MCRYALAFALVLGGMIVRAVADEPQTAVALVHVKVLDIDITAARKMKFEMRVAGSNPAPESALWKRLVNELSQTPVAEEHPKDFFLLTADDPAHGVLQALRKQQLASMIAEPNLAAAFGQPARFNSGGEFPVPTDATGNVVKMQAYGTLVNAVIRERGPDRALVEVEVRLSEIDEKRSVKVGKTVVPALRVFETKTGFEGKWGETVVYCFKMPDQKKGLGDPHKTLRLLLLTPEQMAPLTPAVAAKPGPGIHGIQ